MSAAERGSSFLERKLSHQSEAAADAGLHVAAAEGRHLSQLAGDLDGLVQQQAEVSLVSQPSGARHLTEQI